MHPSTSNRLKLQVESIKERIIQLNFSFLTEENNEDFRYELEAACVSLDDAIEVIERDEAYKDMYTQLGIESSDVSMSFDI